MASLTGFVLVACTGPKQAERKIEPASAGQKRDDAFVLSRQATRSDDEENADPMVHIGDDWWPFRSAYLKVNEAQVRERDASLAWNQSAPGFWDEQTAGEAASIWGTLCTDCHGGRRRIEDALRMPSPAPGWGQGEGLFFGNRRPYADVLGIVLNGGPVRNGKKSMMPAWRGKLANEQVWALLYFLEYQSGGIEGRFPPSLYPRRQTPTEDR